MRAPHEPCAQRRLAPRNSPLSAVAVPAHAHCERSSDVHFVCRNGAHPSLLNAPINAPLGGLLAGGGGTSTTKRRVAPTSGTAPVAETGAPAAAHTTGPALGGGSQGVTAHPGPSSPGVAGHAGPVTAHEGRPFERDAAASV